MKKLLFGAFLIAGTTLGFAKDNLNSALETEKKLSVENVTLSADKEIISVKKICGELVIWEETVYNPNLQTGTWDAEVITHYDHYVYWC